MNRSLPVRILLVIMVVCRFLSPAVGHAQQRVVRPAAAGAALSPAAKAEAREPVLEVRKLIGLGRKGLVKTPEYSTSARKGATPAREWAEISVTYETYPEWTDELVFQYYVMTLSPDDRQRGYSFFKQTVRYVEIKRGRDHVSAVYLHPNTLERYGLPLAIAVEISHEGKVVAEIAETADPALQKIPKWWREPRVTEAETVKLRDGYLLNRKESPFSFVNIDDCEVIR